MNCIKDKIIFRHTFSFKYLILSNAFFAFPAFPVALAQRLPNVALLITQHGGHIAFLQGWFPRGEGYMERVFDQFIRTAVEHPGDLRRACGIKEELLH